MNLDWYLKIALEEAELAYKKKEVPIGAIIVDSNGKIISQAHNNKEENFDPCGHAEIIAIKKASEKLKNWRLTGCHLFVTLEPCPMCLAAIKEARLKSLIFGAYDSKGGALSLGYNFHTDSRFNHQFKITGGIMHYESSRILSRFFKSMRSTHKS